LKPGNYSAVFSVRTFGQDPYGTDRELSANFDQESSATRVERDVSGDVGAYFNVARHAVKCAEQRRTQDGA
jgi:hypothetical protein